MRKDVRFGLTIGAILLAVLIVYVLVVPAERPQEVRLETLSPEGEVVDAPADADTTGAPPAGVMADPLAPAPDAAPAAPAPAEPEVTRTPVVAANETVDWARLLNGGWTAGIESAPAPAPRPAPIDLPSAAPVGAEPVARDLPASPETYTVQAGDNLWTIAQKLFGDGRFHADIQRANPGLNPSRLKVGQVLRLPARAALSAVAPAAVTPAVDEPAIDASRQYRVQAGDNLHNIAKRLYGSAVKADELYQLNRRAIGEDPSKLRIGTILQLPATPQSATAGAQ